MAGVLEYFQKQRASATPQVNLEQRNETSARHQQINESNQDFWVSRAKDLRLFYIALHLWYLCYSVPEAVK